MKTVPEILAEIDRQIKVRLGAERDAVYLLNELKHFILSEPEKCEHVFVPYRREINMRKPEVPLTGLVYIARCDLCGAVK